MWQRIEKQLSAELPFVVYSKSKESEILAILQNDDALNNVIDFSETGFVFAPFESKTDPIIIKSDESYSEEFSSVTLKVNTIDSEINSDSQRNSYIALLKKTINEIESGQFRKVVLSRSLTVENTTSPITLFKRIVSIYKNAFCYLWYHPKVGLWLGATPEILLQTNKAVITTMSLAGTMPYQRVSKPNWGSKEIDEQALVTDFIINALDDKVDNLQKSELETIRAGELLHLRTKITGVLKSNKLQEIISALHPTPAVCGFPKKETMQYILNNESYDREFYAGYLGELNFNDSKLTTLYVNLRCMQKIENIFKIYVGGGVTKDSNPEKEWQETVNKSRTMLRVLSN
ncbi:chorismate-binding protein [Aurantibacter sp.]|uniref:chorismate-binding protein n=1 Tax=Aurantibacter sp. TaxID=2807103 RepID=UPI003266F5D2